MRRGVLSVIGGVSAHAGLCFVAKVPEPAPPGDDGTDARRSDLRLFEDDREIGPAHIAHETIGTLGGGRFSHWNDHLFFSSSDGSDPRANGRVYRCLWGEGDESARARALRQALAVCDDLDEEGRYAVAEQLFAAFVPGEHVGEHSRSLFRDPDFRAQYERFDRANYRSFDRKFALKELAQWAARCAGDFAECGVFKGASAFLLAQVIRHHAPARRLHLFDSFAGLSRPGAHDGSYWREGVLAGTVEEVTRNLADVAASVVFHPGWIPQRFHEVADRTFAFVHIDVDLYEPTRACLEFFAGRMAAGGVIVCDDYGFETCPGARLAVDEFTRARALRVVHLPTGQGVVFTTSP